MSEREGLFAYFGACADEEVPELIPFGEWEDMPDPWQRGIAVPPDDDGDDVADWWGEDIEYGGMCEPDPIRRGRTCFEGVDDFEFDC